ncbi:MAG TPA: WD40 repeat domain-containing protein, partial [Pyrinomonadaceae bacterium]
MCFRIFLGAVLFVTTVSAQQQRPAVEPVKPPSVTVAVSPGGLMLAVARSEGGAAKRSGRVELWNLGTGELQRTITGFDGPIWSLTFSPDGKSIITLSTEFHEAKIQSSVKDRDEKVRAELKWWNTQNGDFVRKVQVGNEGVASVEASWSPAGNLLALVERYPERQLTQVTERGAFQQRIVRPGFVEIEQMELRLLNTDTGERTVKVEDSSKTSRGYFSQIFGRLQRPVFSSDGKLLAAVAGSEVSLWSVDSGKKVLALKKLLGLPAAIAFSPDDRMIAVASIKGSMPGGESEITVWEVSTGKLLNQIKGRN